MKKILSEISCWIFAIITVTGIVQVIAGAISGVSGENTVNISTFTYTFIGLVFAIGGYILLHKEVNKVHKDVE